MRRRPTPERSAGGGRREGGRSPPKITVLLVDEHAMVRAGLQALLEKESDIAVVGQAENGRQAVTLAARLRPDVVVMDIAMPVMNGLEATRLILQSAPATKVLILSAHGDAEYVDHAISLGVAGYVLKLASLEALATAIRAAHGGKRWFDPTLVPARGGGAASPSGGGSPAPARRPVRLSTREAEVLHLIAEGKVNKQMATELGISIKTVEKHRQSLMDKLGIHNVAGLTRHAVATGSIELRDHDPSA